MVRISKPTRICVILSAAILLILAIACLVGVFMVDKLFAYIIGKKVAILPGSEVFENWKSPSVPIYFSIYLYNLTNPNEVLNGSRPRFEEVGPYVYREDRQKYNISFSKESPPKTVRFKHRIFYYFVPELSVASDDVGQITSLDLVTAAIGSSSLATVAQWLYTFEPFVTKTPRELIWGYHSNFLDLCSTISTKCPPRAGLMAQNNGTKVIDYVVDTGAYDPNNVGRILLYDDKKKMTIWGSKEANMINGTDGSVTPPGLKLGTRIHFFVPEMCRSFYSDATKVVYAENRPDIELLSFSSPPEQAMNATLYPPNKVFCRQLEVGPGCAPTGMIPLSPCSDNVVPVFASQPHFYGADPEIREPFDGIPPATANDTTRVHIEPTTGFVLEAHKKLQINMFLDKNKKLTDTYGKMGGPYFFPVAWFTEVALADKPALDRLFNLVMRPKKLMPIILSVIGCWAAVLATLIIVVLVTCAKLQNSSNLTESSGSMAFGPVSKSSKTAVSLNDRIDPPGHNSNNVVLSTDVQTIPEAKPLLDTQKTETFSAIA